MSLTTNQFNTLKAAIIADATAGPLRTAGNTFGLLAWCNGASASLGWRTNVQPQEADAVADYSTYDSLVAGKRDSWSIFLRFQRDFSMNRVRKWITDVWGNATTASNAEAVLQAGTEFATNAQLAIGGTSKVTGTVTALDRSYTGQVSQDEANRLVN